MRVLDFGCRNDRLKVLIEYFKHRVEYVMMDKSPEHKDIIPFEYVKGKKLPFVDDYFDTVLCISVIQYVDDAKGLIDEFLRVCKGEVVITHPTFWWDKHKSFMYVHRCLMDKTHEIEYEYDVIGGRVFGYHYYKIKKVVYNEVSG
jgi:ubiquinone/menaquinone biosynthesis C-methylase UbiE